MKINTNLMLLNYSISEEKNAFMEEIPLGRFGLPDEVGDLAVFLASEKSKYLTGQVIPLDGGYL